ncbi:MICOS complex subunit MIC13 [Trichosurus vulpecula]|uniref:MICOS complex subunit MIC13 n=1 Tax=Trichosurus vulpecula TaxID=9337 RepID=UPI00186B088E|nr:MICOS complex subunit MIC13 [Trichosurus vulpecula]
MAARLWPVFGFFIKAGLAGGSVYFVYDQGLLGSSYQGQAALRRAQEAIPVAVTHYSDLLSKHTGVRLELPPTPHFNINLRDSWNSGINSLMSSLSTAPSTIQAYGREAWNYMKGQK